MADSIWPTIHTERAALADDLDGLTDAQWSTRSLCSEWDVHQALAHLVSSATMTPPKFLRKFAAARFNFDRFTAGEVSRLSRGGPAATLAAFRAAQQRTSAPPGPKETWLGEAFVHGEDIRRPLGIAHDYAAAQVARALQFYAKSNAIIGGRDRVAGLTLRATDTDLSVGSGPLVEGPVMSLLLAASGRPCALDELSGPGVEVLRQRF
ncbi:MAG: maleylpyruvate isomerase family mycothiol-dependent enzyme [Jatrophihabitans sp.]|uniref:maleylpyruvate isomerase family mycothiol-dependent enzyme n=1 Tax=Jatrophihabitans sp. TaxID=1932789 RepID=UPI00390F963E